MTADSPLPALIEVNGLSASYGHVAALKPLEEKVETLNESKTSQGTASSNSGA